MAIASLLAFLAFIAAAWTGTISERLADQVGPVVFLAFFGSVAIYFVAYRWDWRHRDDDGPSPESLSAYERSEKDSDTSMNRAQAGELYIVAALMSILILGLLGSLVSNPVGIAGTAVGALLTVLAVAYYVWFAIRTFRTRERFWIEMGRRRWQFVAYVVLSFAVMIAAVTLRVLYHSKIATGGLVVASFFLLIRLRLFLQDLW